jgi:K+-transporting ATPase ATPase A chain
MLSTTAILVLAGLASVHYVAVSRLAQTGPHGLSALLVAFATNTANNGQGFASFGADSDFIHATTMIAMMVGRFLTTITALVIAGSIAMESRATSHAGILPTDTPLFGGFLLGLIIIVQTLAFLPAFALGPVVEQLLL